MLPLNWKPQPHPLVRLGSAGDGGYFVSPSAVTESQVLVSMGLSDDWSFEEHFRSINQVPVICFDHTVTARFWIKRIIADALQGKFSKLFNALAYRRFFRGDVVHRKLCVGYDVSGGISLNAILRDIGDAKVFLKIDIEGAEYRLLDEIAQNASRITGIAIELHSIDLHRERIEAFLASLPDFVVVALNANNCGGVDGSGDPLVVEMTLTHKNLLGGTLERPLATAVANDPSQPQIELTYA